MNSFEKLLTILGVSLSSSFARLFLRPSGNTFWDHFFSVLGSTLLGVSVGLTCSSFVPSQYLMFLVAVCSSAGREIVDLLIRSIKSFSPKLDKFIK